MLLSIMWANKLCIYLFMAIRAKSSELFQKTKRKEKE